MSGDGRLSADRAAALRAAFDRGFAEPRPVDPAASEDLLAVRIGQEPYALRLEDIASLFAGKKITPLPGSTSALRGIAGFRGAIVPVYDLPVLLGHRAEEGPHWLALAAVTPVALAFGVLEGHLRVAIGAIAAHETAAHSPRHVRNFARTGEVVRPIVDIPSVLDAIRRLVATNLNPEAR